MSSEDVLGVHLNGLNLLERYQTPDVYPATTNCRVLLVPDDLRIQAAIGEMLGVLTNPGVWDESSGMSAGFTAALVAEMMDKYQSEECAEGGGMGDYTLHTDLELNSDVATFTVSSLASLSGRDLIIQFDGATAHTSVTDLYVQVNGLGTSIYDQTQTRWKTSTSYTDTTDTKIRLAAVLPATTTPQDRYGSMEILIPDWKADDRWKTLIYRVVGGGWNAGVCVIQELAAIDSLTVGAWGQDIKAGSKIAVYSRG